MLKVAFLFFSLLCLFWGLASAFYNIASFSHLFQSFGPPIKFSIASHSTDYCKLVLDKFSFTIQLTAMSHPDELTVPVVVSSSGQWPQAIGEFSQLDAVSDSEHETNLATSNMHLWWRAGSGMSGYRHVAVLLVKWAENLDELKCGDEVGYKVSYNSRPYHKLMQ